MLSAHAGMRDRHQRHQQVPPRALPVSADPLERRTLLSVSLSAATGVLAVAGTDAADQVAVRVSPSNPNDLHVQDGATIFIYRLAQVNSIQVIGGGGDDTLTLDTRNGLLARAGAEMPLRFEGGAGADSLVITGGPASGGVAQTLTLGPAADAGTHVSKAGALAQNVGFAGVESLVDLSIAASLTVVLNEAANLVELANGPLVNGLATASLKAYDVTPCDHETALPPQPAAAQAAQASTASVAGSTAAVTAIDPETVPDEKARKKLLKAYQREARKAKAEQLRQLRQQQREQRLLAKRQRKTAAASASTASVVAAPAAATGRELVLGKTYVGVQFANKGRVTIDTGAGDDWVAVDHGTRATGLTALTVEGGAGVDALAEQSKPAGVTWSAAGAENVSPARSFILVNECTEPPAPQPQPDPPAGPTTPTSPTSPSASNGSIDRDDDDDDDASSSGSRDNDASSSGSRDSDSSRSGSRDSGSSSSGSRDRGSSSSSSRDSNASGSNGD